MFFHKPSITSTFDSAQRIATPPHESDLDENQFPNMLASPLYLQERDVSADRPRVYHSFREKLTGQFISLPRRCRETCRVVLTQKKVESINIFQQKAFLQDIKRFKEKVKHSSGSNPEEATRLVLEEQRDHQLAEAKSEILKQECIVDALNTCIREFQRQALFHRLELDSVNCGYEESRREQARLHEELAQRVKALLRKRIGSFEEDRSPS